MKPSPSKIRIALISSAFLIGATIMGISTLTRTIAHHHPTLGPLPPFQHVSKVPGKAAKTERVSTARHIALERYAFAHRLEIKMGVSLPATFDVASQTVLFPIGRSDRMYLCCQYFDETSLTGDSLRSAIYCYQRKNGQDQLVYQVPLKLVHRRQIQTKPIRSLLDYITDFDDYGSYALRGKISTLARKDLATRRDYVEYYLNSYVGDFRVCLLSEIKDEDPPYPGQTYDPEIDPMTKAHLKWGMFFAKYGFPVAKGELRAIR